MGRTGKMWLRAIRPRPDILNHRQGDRQRPAPGRQWIARSELMDWPAGAHASTFGGNPVAVAAALATLDLLEATHRERRRVGAYLMSRMSDCPSASPSGRVRGLV